MRLVNRATKIFIVEGENRDLRFIESITGLYLKDFDDSVIISVPAAGNIYMLYKKLEEDDFETDVIELVRENIETARDKLINISRDSVTEIYLLFDADLHNNNITGNDISQNVLDKMLTVFNNETENGKLYISYPMVESLYDIIDGKCKAFSKCFVPIDDFIKYKSMSGCGNSMASRHFNSRDDWKKAIRAFYLRTRCLLGEDRLTYNQYKQLISPKTIFDLQRGIIEEDNAVFVLSALPELLLDYFREDFWKDNVGDSVMADHFCEDESRANRRRE